MLGEAGFATVRAEGPRRLYGADPAPLREVEPTSLSASWEFGCQVSRIELTLAPEDEGTRLARHVAHVDDERWAQFGPGAVGVGWDGALTGLGGHLGSGAAVDPSEAEAWMASDGGRRFYTLSSERWGEASVAAGTDREAAEAAAARTTAFYTGRPA